MFSQELERFVQRIETSLDVETSLEVPVEAGNPEYGAESTLDFEVSSSDFRLRFGSDEDLNSLVVQDFNVDEPLYAPELAEACAALAKDLECGSILLPGEVPAESRIQRIGYRRQFYHLLAGGPGMGPPIRSSMRPSSKSILKDDWGDRLSSYVSELLSRDVTWKVSADRRPYIFSIDFEAPEFHCYVHFHEITGSMFIEKLEVPKELRNRGIGSRIVNQLKNAGIRGGFGYVYLVAKKEAERFWANQNFEYVLRLNLRNLERRERAIRREPGWDHTWVNGERLPEPYWCYRNHPQDDIDFCKGLALWTGIDIAFAAEI